MKFTIIHVGLDVDDTQYHGSAFHRDSGEVMDFQCRPTFKGLLGQLAKHFPGCAIKVCYEASYVGYSLHGQQRSPSRKKRLLTTSAKSPIMIVLPATATMQWLSPSRSLLPRRTKPSSPRRSVAGPPAVPRARRRQLLEHEAKAHLQGDLSSSQHHRGTENSARETGLPDLFL